MDEPRTEMTTESLTLALEDNAGLTEAVCKVAQIKTLAEYLAYIKACRDSPVHLRELFDKLSPKRR